ncbi:hypothetical protein L6472_06110 [Prevotella sp. E13-17]|uniref:hypothetical protein n=1 Tax=Prevotella sp. E13-17 TaxID=2913616 RepID=UPI001EDA3B13|nr:hypothetical protein [Prevotella sp. E13-17]UKK52152.1 hypothetical protein L6472_06110 [Prevotella sp. E13-17]
MKLFEFVMNIRDYRVLAQAKDIALRAIHSIHIAPGAVTSEKIAPGAIGNDGIADGAVTTDKLQDGSVTSSKIANNTIGSSKIADNAVSSEKIAPGAVTTEKIQDGSINGDNIAPGTITKDKFAPSAIMELNNVTKEAEDAAALANDNAVIAKNQGDYAKNQGDYAKNQGDYAKNQGDYAKNQADGAKGGYPTLNHRLGNIDYSIETIKECLPTEAGRHNQLADKDFVNSSIATATADFKGTYNSLAELRQVVGNSNDYAYVIDNDSVGNTVYMRYKWSNGDWHWEFDLNNSSYTAAQWAAIKSGITAALVTKLTDLPTNTELNQRMQTAIATELASYYTKAEIDAQLQIINISLSGKASQTDLTVERNRAKAAEREIKDRVLFMEKSFGKYDGEREITLQQAKAGKYVNTDGGESAATGYGISTPITLNAGDILLIPSAQAVPASVSVVARMVDRTYQKVIVYIYTYREDHPELPATATADYDATLVYTAVYDESGDTPVLTGWMRNGDTYTKLPATREVSEQFYEPLMKQAVAAMPSTGYYIYLSPTAMTVVVSGLTATVSGGTALVVGWGIFKNITTNFVGAPGQSVLAQAFAVLFAAIDGLKAQLSDLGETRADSIDFGNLPRFCGQPMVIEAAGAPASPILPTMVGQRYHDTTNKKVYEAFSVTGSISDWVLLN